MLEQRPTSARRIVPGLGSFSLVALVFAHGPSLAKDTPSTHPLLRDRFSISAGVFFPDRKLKFELDGNIVGKTEIVDFSETFRFDGTDRSVAFEFGWRFADAWSLQAQLFSVQDATDAVVGTNIEWGNYIYEAGKTVSAATDVQITRIFPGRRFQLTEGSELGVGIGFHWLNIDAVLEGEATFNGQSVGVIEQVANTDGPLPNLGAWYDFSPSEDWLLRARLDWLSVSIDQYDGKIVNAAIGVIYGIAPNFGLGLNYQYFELDAAVNESSWRGRIFNRFHGPYISLTGYW